MALSKAKILAAEDTKTETVAVPEWGGEVCIKTLSGTERDAFEESYRETETKNFRQRFLVLTLCDEKGKRLFKDSEIEDVGGKSATVLNRLFEQAWALNALRSEDAEKLGEDSPSDQSGDSTSG